MKSKEQCCDDRFEIINETKQYIINATNIETSPEEMNVLDSICFRLWQLGLTKRNKDKLKELTHQPALLECIKEWETLGYEFKEDQKSQYIFISSLLAHLEDKHIHIFLNHSTRVMFSEYGEFTTQELMLLVQTLKALEVEKCEK